MSDYLRNLMQRALGTTRQVQPFAGPTQAETPVEPLPHPASPASGRGVLGEVNDRDRKETQPTSALAFRASEALPHTSSPFTLSEGRRPESKGLLNSGPSTP